MWPLPTPALHRQRARQAPLLRRAWRVSSAMRATRRPWRLSGPAPCAQLVPQLRQMAVPAHLALPASIVALQARRSVQSVSLALCPVEGRQSAGPALLATRLPLELRSASCVAMARLVWVVCSASSAQQRASHVAR